MIRLYDESEITAPYEKGWDFPLEELDYVCLEHDGEDFMLKNGRLVEIDYGI